MKLTFVLWSAMLTVSCQERFKPLSERIGVVSTKAGAACLEIENPSLTANSQVRVVNLNGQPTREYARVGARTASCGSRSDDGHLTAYSLRFEPGAAERQQPAIGIVGYTGKLEKDGELVTVDLDGNGQLEYLRFCTSTEGLHFTAWTSKHLTGKLRWHQYQYLGYDVSPTCTDAEIGSGK